VGVFSCARHKTNDSQFLPTATIHRAFFSPISVSAASSI
jgi:hypothetical protein